MNCNASGFGPPKREFIIPVLGGEGKKTEFKASLGYIERPYLKTKTNTAILFIYLFTLEQKDLTRSIWYT